MRFFVCTVLLIFLILTLLQFTVSFKDWSIYKERVLLELESIYNTKAKVRGEIKISLIAPKLIVYNVYVQQPNSNIIEQKLSDLISIGKVEIRPSFASLFFSFSLRPSSFTLSEMKSNRKNFIYMMNKKVSKVDIIIKNSQISLSDNLAEYNNSSVADIKEILIRKSGHFNSKVKIGDNNYYCSGKISTTARNLYLNIDSNFTKLSFVGNRNQNDDIQGKLVLTINNSSSFIRDIAKTLNLNFLPFATLSENIKIVSNVNLNKKYEFKIIDLKIYSQRIQAIGLVQGIRNNDHINININFSEVNLVLIKNWDLQKTNLIRDLLECFRNIVPINLSMNLTLEILNIRYENMILNKFYAILKFYNGEVKVDTSLQFATIDNVCFLSGKISNNDGLSEFNGTLLIKGEDLKSSIFHLFPFIEEEEKRKEKNQFVISSKLYLAPRMLSISDIRFLKNKDVEFLQGLIVVSYTKKRNVIEGKLNVSNLELDTYNYTLLSKLSRLKWLKNLKYYVNIRTSVSGFALNNIKADNLCFFMKIERGKLSLDKIKLLGEDFEINGSMKLLVDSKYTKPLLDMNLRSSKFNSSVLTLPSLVEVRRDLKSKINQIQWSRRQMSFLETRKDFDADIKINITELRNKYSLFKNFNLNVVIINNIVTIKKVDYNVEHGQVSFQGYLRSDSMYVKFAIVNLDIRGISKILGIYCMDGQISLNGSIRTQGRSFSDWVNNSSGKIDLQAKEIRFRNIDLNSFITELLNNKSKSEISRLINTDIYQKSTYFKNINGNSNVKNGICSTSLQFEINQASGSISSNLILSNFTLISLLRFFFVLPGYTDPVYIDIQLGGPIWDPKIIFNEDQIFSIMSKNIW